MKLNHHYVLIFASILIPIVYGTGIGTANPNDTTTEINQTVSTGDIPDRIADAIALQESNGDCSAENGSGSGASGCYQIMPENIPVWSKEAIGRSLTVDEFMSNPQLQHQIARFKINQFWQEELNKAGGNESIAVRRVAARWYSGQGDLYTSTNPQSWNGNSYPSIKSYSDSVAQKAGF